MRIWLSIGVCWLAIGPVATAPGARAAAPQTAEANAGVDPARLAGIDALVEDAIAHKELPGAVVLVWHDGRVVYRKAFGHRALEPAEEPMTEDTIFDLASLTKVVATTPSVMMLVEEGKIRLNDRVATFIPEFAKHGKGDITIRQLLTHESGLRPDLDLADPWTGADTAIQLAADEVPIAAPDERFIYSDINFELLGEIVRRVSGMRLDEFARRRIFEPLGMRDTMFLPPAALRPRIAPTERCTPFGWPCEVPGAEMLRGVVHDPTARRMGGVAGHAGLFSTAADLATYCRMLVGGGALESVRILSALTVAKMTSPATPAGERNVRGLGWDLDSAYSSNRGELFPIGSFGHTGFTGTSIWIDPATGTFVVFLSNRVHPDGKGDVTPLRARVATVVASALTDVPAAVRAMRLTGSAFGPAGPAPAAPGGDVLAGIDVLRADGFAPLRGRRVGLLTNHSGRARDGRSTIDLLHEAKDVTLVALFSPEHGIRDQVDAPVPSGRDEQTGLPIYSLYGQGQRPTPEMLKGIDTLVVDLQDVGARFYTYKTTMAYAMEAAARQGVKVVVLDRPNPIGGFRIEGPIVDADQLDDFVNYFPMPIRHGLTMGEMARLFNGENKIGADLTVVPMRGWQRDLWYDQTGLAWVNPSPNMRNMNEAALYPGLGAIEWTNLSVGRGTDTPFEQVGAPWIDGVALAGALNARHLAGVRFYPVWFTPASSTYAGERCHGVFILVTDRDALRPARVGLEIASALARLYGAHYELDKALSQLGSRETIARIRAGDDPAAIAAGWAADEARWRSRIGKYLLYR